MSKQLIVKCFGVTTVTARKPKSSFIMMQWVLPLALACVMLGTPAQPTACADDSQCTTGYYCLSDVHSCRECLRCEDLNRESPTSAVSCIRSVVECGSCLKGLVDDRRGVVGAGCTEPERNGAALPAYVIVIIVICLMLFALVVVALVYILRHKDTFKILASTRTSVQAPVPPSAPQPPPPYNFAAQYEPVRPCSPPAPAPLEPAHYHDEVAEGSQPLVKRAPSVRGGGGGAGGVGGARESAGSQAARVYHNPAYVRNAQPPPSYESALSDESDHEPFVPQDEDTVPSAWTPAGPSGDANGNEAAATGGGGGGKGGGAAEAAGGALALRRPSRSDTVSPPHKMIRLSEDSNNNRNHGESSGGIPREDSVPAAPSVIIKVLNVNQLLAPAQ